MIELSNAQLITLKSNVLRAVEAEFSEAYANGTIEEMLNKYGISIEDAEPPQPVNRRMKILVVGALSGKKNDYIMAARKLGIFEDNLVFVDYDEMSHFSLESLRYSTQYSDIICGPIPHKVKDLGDDNSLIAKLKDVENKNAFPKLIFANTNQNDVKLRFSISGFMEALQQTKLFKEINNIY